MKKTRRIQSLVLAFALLFTTLFGTFSMPVVAKADGGVTVVFHYLRDDGDYDKWNMWIWEDNGGCDAGHPFTGKGDKGVECTFKVTPGTQKVGFIVRTDDWAKDPDGDRFVELAGATSGTIHVYCKTGEAEFTTEFGDDVQVSEQATKATVVDGDYTKLVVTMTKEVTDDMKDKFAVLKGDEQLAINSVDASGTTATLNLKDALSPTGSYTLKYADLEPIKVDLPDYFSTDAFEKEYTYEGNDLGATWSKDKTVFKVWAPTAKLIQLNLYDAGNDGEPYKTVDMTLGEKGVWSYEEAGDLNGKYYTYKSSFDDGKEYDNIVDPYAKSVGVNGDRGMILDLDSTDPEGWDKDTRHTVSTPTNLFLYELHVRDFSSHEDSGIPAEHVGKYLAFTDKGTKTKSGISTGIDHLVDLGINAVHILPSYDFGSIDEKNSEGHFNWGYDPKNYNAPEGSYSTDPYHGEVRVNEYKQMVQALHNENIGLVMDVVYNHTQSNAYCFNLLVPGYFFRKGSNASGCGNDVASERSMVRKFIVDSCVYWASEYHLDGFRFDLMAILDVDCMNAIRKALDEIDPEIVIYGEGWWASAPILTKENVTPSLKANTSHLDRIAAFSDDIRDGIKGSVFTASEKGYANGNYGKRLRIVNGVLGNQEWAPNPTQCINYAACHDNNTLWDVINISNKDDSEESKISQNMFAAAIYMTAQGIPFTLSGEEFCRTKVKADGSFDENSYSSPDSVNTLDYTRIETYGKVYDYYKGLIAFRKAHAALRQSTKDEVNSTVKMIDAANLDSGVIAYSIEGAKNEVSDGLFVIYNPLLTDTKVTLPEGDWSVCVNNEKAGTEELAKVSGEVSVAPISCMILVKGKLAPETLEEDYINGENKKGEFCETSATGNTTDNTTGNTTNNSTNNTTNNSTTNTASSSSDDGGINPAVIGLIVIAIIAGGVYFVKKRR